MADGPNQNKQTRAGIQTIPWGGASAVSSVERQVNEEGTRVFSAHGLKQTWHVKTHWVLSAGLDKTYTVKDDTAEHNARQNDYTALTGGAKYSVEKFSWDSRIETHKYMSQEKHGLATTVSGEPRRGIGLSAGLQAFKLSSIPKDSLDARLKLGGVYRPSKSPWIVLDRLDLIYEDVTESTLSYNNWRVVNNITANYSIMHKGQVSVH